LERPAKGEEIKANALAGGDREELGRRRFSGENEEVEHADPVYRRAKYQSYKGISNGVTHFGR
jgi:hypothetical protein